MYYGDSILIDVLEGTSEISDDPIGGLEGTSGIF